LKPGQPAIYYGNKKGTHFVATIDGIELWDPYDPITQVQVDKTDHFCQTFSLMFMEHEFLPNGHVGRQFKQIVPGDYIHNAWIAKNVATHILRKLVKSMSEDDLTQFVDALDIGSRHKKSHQFIDPRKNKHVDKKHWMLQLITYCESLTEDDFMMSTFREIVL
jgi:hypothetical protein